MAVDPASATLAPFGVSLGDVSLEWLSPRSANFTIRDTRAASDPALTRIGALTFRGVLQRADRVLPPDAVSATVTGCWGAFDVPRVASVVASGERGDAAGLSANDTVTIVFDIATSTPDPVALLDWSARPGAWVGSWASWSRLVVTIVDASPGAGAATRAATRIGALMLRCAGIQPRDRSAPPGAPSAYVTGEWGNAVAGVRGGEALGTAGDELVTLVLADALGARGGLDASASYDNGNRIYAASGCALAAPAGDTVTCRTAPGVGVGFAWTLTLDHVTLALATPDDTSYAPPVIGGVSVFALGGKAARSRALVTGGQLVRITGENFGAAAENALSYVLMWARGYAAVTWAPQNCSVTVDHVEVTCTLPPSAGAHFEFSLRVAGQITSGISLDAEAPAILGVAAAPLATRGGTRITLRGSLFGVSVPGYPPLVAYGGAGLEYAAAECAVAVAHTTIECVAAPGYGAALRFQVTVLGVASAVLTSNASYGAPLIASVGGAPPATAGGSAVTVMGANFAIEFPSVAVALLDGAPLPSAFVVVTPMGVVVTVPAGTGRFSLAVLVGAQVSNAVNVSYAAPVVSGAGVEGGGAGARHVVIAGANFGSDTGAVSVMIGGAACTVSRVADAAIHCTTAASEGPVSVVVAGAASDAASPFRFDASASQPAPILTGIVNVTSLPLLGGGVVTLHGGSLLPPPPGFGLIARASDAGLCAAAPVFCASSVRAATAVACTLRESPLRRVAVVAINVIGSECRVSAAALVVEYDPPVVDAAAPVVIDTAGGDVVTLDGHNFEADAAVSIGGAPCAALARESEARISCRAPPGVGRAAHVVVSGTPVGARLGYAPPTLRAVSPAHGPSGALITLTGSHFGAAPTVLIGGRPAAAAPGGAEGSALVRAPAWAGAGWDVVVVAGGQNASLPRAFSYLPPALSGVDAPFVDGALGGALNVSGAGFGPRGSGVPVAVSLGGVPCDAVGHVSDSVLTCTAPPALLVGSTPLVVTVAGLSGSLAVDVACPRGFFGAAGERCQVCPQGALCAGRGADPTAMAGFWRTSRAEFTPCIPAEACEAAGSGGGGAAPVANCNARYTGDQCRACALGNFRRDSSCVSCPGSAGLLLALFVAMILLVGGLAAWLHRRMVRGGRDGAAARPACGVRVPFAAACA